MTSKRWRSIRPPPEAIRHTSIISRKETLCHQSTEDHRTDTDIGVSFEEKRVALSRKDRENHTHVIGSTGTGKSKFMEYMIRQDILDRTAGFCLIDPHGSLYDEILLYASHRHPRLADRVVLFNPTDASDHIIGFNPIPEDIEFIDYTLDTLISACLKAWGQDNTDRTPRITKWLENIFYPLIINKLTLVESVPMINIHANAGRQALLQHVSSDVVLDDWQMFESSTQTQRQNLIEGASNRLRKFLRNDIIRQIIGQQRHTLDFAQAMEEGKIVLINLSGGNKISHENAQLLGIMIVNEIFRIAKLRDPRDPKLKPFRLYIDEFAQFVTRDIARALEEARKYKLFLTLAHQHLAQLRSEDEYLYASVMTNCKNKVVFGGLSKEDAALMTDEISTGFVDLTSIKNEMYTTKVRHIEETRTVRSTHHSASTGESTTRTEGSSHALGQSTGTSTSQGRSESRATASSTTHGTSVTETDTSTTGRSQGVNQSKSHSHSTMQGTQQGQSHGTSHTDQQSTSLGKNTTKTEGHSHGDSWSQSDGHSESNNQSQGFNTGKGSGESQNYHGGGGLSPDAHSFQSSQQHGRNTSIAQTQGSNTSQSEGGSHSRNESSSSGTSNTATTGHSDGTNQSQSQGRSQSQSDAHSQSQGTQSSEQSSVSQGHSSGKTDTHGSSQTHTHSTQYNTSKQRSESQTTTNSTSQTTGGNQSETHGKSESTVPFLRPEEYQALTSQTFWTKDELHYMEMATIKNQTVGEAFIKIDSHPPIRTKIDYVTSVPYSPRFSPQKIAAFQQRVYAAHPESYLSVLEAPLLTRQRQTLFFGEPIRFDEQVPALLEQQDSDEENDIPTTEDPFT